MARPDNSQTIDKSKQTSLSLFSLSGDNLCSASRAEAISLTWPRIIPKGSLVRQKSFSNILLQFQKYQQATAKISDQLSQTLVDEPDKFNINHGSRSWVKNSPCKLAGRIFCQIAFAYLQSLKTCIIVFGECGHITQQESTMSLCQNLSSLVSRH